MSGAIRLNLTQRCSLRCLNVSGSDTVTLDVVLSVLRADVLCEHLEAALGSCISRYRLTTKLRHHGACVDDLAVALLDHAWKDSLCAEERTGEIDIDNLIPLLLRHLNHRDSLDDAGIIYQDINTTELLLDILHECVYLLLVRNITYDTVCIDAELLVLCDTSVYELLIDIIENDLLCASLSKCLRICTTQSIGCAGYPCNLAIKSELIKNSSHKKSPFGFSQFQKTRRPPWTAALKHSRSVMPARSKRKLKYTQPFHGLQGQ